MPELYLDVGELDLFCNEGVEYALKLMKAGVTTELHVHTGVPHGFESWALDSGVSQRATADRVRAVKVLRET
jgi:acetyl esterase/lipase